MKKSLCLAIAMVGSILATNAQCSFPAEPESWYFGFTGGYRHTFMQTTKIDKDLYPKRTGLDNGVFSVYLQKFFLRDNKLGIRPEVAFTNRGGGLKNIYINKEGYYDFYDISDITYNVRAHYVDIRIPVIYQFLDNSSRFRPYVYVAPILGFNTGGYIENEIQTNLDPAGKGYNYLGLHLDATKANMNSIYFAAAAAVGVNWNFNIEGNPFYLGLEAMYEYGFTDTYGKDTDALNKYALAADGIVGATQTSGERKFSGIEVKLTLGVPFSVFHKKAPAPAPVEDVVVVSETVKELPVEVIEEPEQLCYSLEEINSMMLQGLSVAGKTICAIDDAINFDTGKSVIKPISYDYLNRLAETLKKTNSRIKIKGHTDNVGTEDFNLNLSRDRAMSVLNYLLERGVKRANLSYDYYGMSCPLTDNDTEEGRRLNRRVEFEIMN